MTAPPTSLFVSCDGNLGSPLLAKPRHRSLLDPLAARPTSFPPPSTHTPALRVTDSPGRGSERKSATRLPGKLARRGRRLVPSPGRTKPGPAQRRSLSSLTGNARIRILVSLRLPVPLLRFDILGLGESGAPSWGPGGSVEGKGSGKKLPQATTTEAPATFTQTVDSKNPSRGRPKRPSILTQRRL